MKRFLFLFGVSVAVSVFPSVAKATIIWSDEVVDYTSKIQNYGGDLLEPSTLFWIEGAPDADVDGNGYAWDTVDQDYVAGWRSNAPNESITVSFNTGLVDAAGDDLSIVLYSGTKANAEVLASVNGVDFTQIGTLGSGISGDLRTETFDLSGLFDTAVFYVKVVRVGNGPQTGMFFDAFGGTAIPEPNSVVLLLTAVGFFTVSRRRLLAVNLAKKA